MTEVSSLGLSYSSPALRGSKGFRNKCWVRHNRPLASKLQLSLLISGEIQRGVPPKKLPESHLTILKK